LYSHFAAAKRGGGFVEQHFRRSRKNCWKSEELISFDQLLCHYPRMKPCAWLGMLLTLVCWLPVAQRACAADPASRIKVLIVDGYSNHDWQRTTALIRGILDKTGLFEVSVATAPAVAGSAAYNSWSPQFMDYDVIIQTCNDLGGAGPLWPASVRETFDRFVREGGGVFVFHAGNNAFATWDAYNEIIGLGWRKKEYGWALRIAPDESIDRIPPGQGAGTSHGDRADRVIHRLVDHPINAGLPRRWKTPQIEVYNYPRGPANKLTVLSWAEDPKTSERWPTEWVVQYGEGRVYNSTFGHVWKNEADPVNLRCAGFQTIMVRALQWLAKRPVTYPVPQDFPTEQNIVLRPLDSSAPAASK
jgi:type 1 glutamine amidotransferase